MNGPSKLIASEDQWNTQMGLVFPGKRVVFRGKDLFRDLKDLRWMELLLYGITGRFFDPKQIRLFEGIWSLGTSYPDPRIWNNRIASLAGTSRSTATLGIGAAIAISEATVYGRGPDVKAIDFFFRTKRALDNGEILSDIVRNELEKYRGIAGYARPFVNDDERIKPVTELATSLGFGNGNYLGLAYEVEKTLLKLRYRIKMNAAALGAALAADQGLSCYEYYLYLTPAFIGGMLPCYIEAAGKEEGTFLPFACDRIEYIGPSNRSWD